MKVTLLIFIIGFLFEYFIIPFQRNPDEHLYGYAVISLFHVGVASFIYLMYFGVVSFLINDEDWKVYKELLAMAFLLFFIGIGEWAIRDVIYDHPNNWALNILIEEVWHAYLSGSVIIILVLSFNYNLLMRKNLAHALDLGIPKGNADRIKQGAVFLETQTKSDDFQLDPSQLLCVKADGNYSEFYIKQNDEIQKLIKRITLQNTKDQLQSFPYLVKTHRAFLLNGHKVTKIDGNAQGFQVSIEGLPFTIPVSRKNIDDFNSALQNI